jgi:transcriptional regulator with XRE-family HTH domain
VSTNRVGPLVKQWRAHRSRSQFDVAIQVGVSPKHLSFVETGRARPSPELIDALGVHLEIPLRERNAMLLAAGFAPRYRHTPVDDPEMAPIVASIQRLLDAHDPFPGVALDRCWNVVLANRAAGRLVDLLPAELAGPPMNVFRASLHPDGFARLTVGFDEWAGYLLRQLDRLAALSADPLVSALRTEVHGYPNIIELRERHRDWAAPRATPDLLVPFRMRINDIELSTFTTLTTFGTPQDVTLEELAIELFSPTNESTARFFETATGSATAMPLPDR